MLWLKTSPIRTGFIVLVVMVTFRVKGFSVQKHFYATHKDKLPEKVSKTLKAKSMLICAVTCIQDITCVTFGFSSARKSCHLISWFVLNTDVLSHNEGVRIYSEKKESYGLPNLALGKVVFSTDCYFYLQPSRAVDGNINTYSRSLAAIFDPYLVIDLGDIFHISLVILRNPVFFFETLHDVNIDCFNDNPHLNQSEKGICCGHVPGLLSPGPTTIKCERGTMGKFMRISKEKSDILTLSEVEIYGEIAGISSNENHSSECPRLPGGINLALNKPVVQSTTLDGNSMAVLATDGKRTPFRNIYSKCPSTAEGDYSPWLQVDLESEYNITSFTITNRRDDATLRQDRLSNVSVDVFTTDPRYTSSSPTLCKFIPWFGMTIRTFRCDGVTIGRFIRVSKPTEYLEICELEVTGEPVT